MPFRMPPPTSSSSIAPTGRSSPARPVVPAPPSARAPSIAPSTSTSTTTLRLPGPPLPPKPLHLTIRNQSTSSRATTAPSTQTRGRPVAAKGSKRAELPRWSRLGTKQGSRDDNDDEEAEEPTMQQLVATSISTDNSPSKRSTASTSGVTFNSAVETLRIARDAEGDSTIRRKSIYFDPSETNPFLPPAPSSPTTRTSSPRRERDDIPADDGAARIKVEADDLSRVEILHLSASPSSESPGPASLSPKTSHYPPPPLELPDSPSLAVSLHPFSGEPDFGELSFGQGIELCIEVEDLGGGWSLGYLKAAGENARGLIPRGWYAYVDVSIESVPSRDLTSDPDKSTEATRGELDSTGLRSERGRIDTSSDTCGPHVHRSFDPTPSNPPLSTAPQERRVLESTERPHLSRSTITSAEAQEGFEIVQKPNSCATGSIGRNLVVSGAEFEPIELERETVSGLGGSPRTVTSWDEEFAATAPKVEEYGCVDDTVTGALGQGSNEGPEETATGGPLHVSRDVVRMATIDRSTSPSLPVTLPANAASTNVSVPSHAAGPDLDRVVNPTQSNFLYRLGIVASPSSAISRSYILGGLSIPGASVLAHSHPRRPPSPPLEPKKPRLSRSLGTMKGRGYVLDWIERGDEFDEDVTEYTQIWDIDNDNGPIWRCVSELPFRVQVHSPRKLSPLGETPYTAFQVTTRFSSSSPPGENPATPLTVLRRYSHFVGLHELVSARYSPVTIPSLPPQGGVVFGQSRFSPEFVEERRCDLERWIGTVTRHPVLSDCEEVRGFLAIQGEEELGALLSRTSTTSNCPPPLFFARVFHSEFNVDLDEAVEIGQRFERHARAIELGRGVRNVETSVQGLRQSLRGTANSFQNLSSSLVHLVAGLNLPPASYDAAPVAAGIETHFDESETLRSSRRAREWNVQNEHGAMTWKDSDADALAVSKAVQATGEALDEVSEVTYASARYELSTAQLGLQELAQPATQYSNLIEMHNEAIAAYRRLTRTGTSEPADQAEKVARCETILNITCAEMDFIRSDRVRSLGSVVKSLLDVQIEATKKSLEQFEFARGHFDDEALQALALTGPRVGSPLERREANARRYYDPLPTVRSFMAPRSAASAVRGAIESTLLRRTSTQDRRSASSVLGRSREGAGGAEDGDGTLGEAESWREGVFEDTQ